MYNESKAVEKKYFNSRVRYILGGGCSRTGALMEDSSVVKIPKVGVYRERAGLAEYEIFEELLLDFVNNNQTHKAIEKLIEGIHEGRQIPPSCLNNATEFLFSNWICRNYPERAEAIAQCIDIAVSKVRGNSLMIVTKYENARLVNRNSRGFNGKIGNYRISDLHDENYVRGLLVDYACIRYANYNGW